MLFVPPFTIFPAPFPIVVAAALRILFLVAVLGMLDVHLSEQISLE